MKNSFLPNQSNLKFFTLYKPLDQFENSHANDAKTYVSSVFPLIWLHFLIEFCKCKSVRISRENWESMAQKDEFSRHELAAVFLLINLRLSFGLFCRKRCRRVIFIVFFPSLCEILENLIRINDCRQRLSSI